MASGGVTGRTVTGSSAFKKAHEELCEDLSALGSGGAVREEIESRGDWTGALGIASRLQKKGAAGARAAGKGSHRSIAIQNIGEALQEIIEAQDPKQLAAVFALVDLTQEEQFVTMERATIGVSLDLADADDLSFFAHAMDWISGDAKQPPATNGEDRYKRCLKHFKEAKPT